MTAKDIGSVLNFAAFRPEPDDPSAGWSRRFPTRRTALLAISRTSMAWCALQRTGRPGEATEQRGEFKELMAQTSFQIKDATDGGWCAVLLNTRYVISLEANLSRRPGSEDLVKANPRSVLGARYERGKRYAITHNPETNSSILLACDEEHIRKVETTLKESGLNIGRVCCGAYVLLRHALDVTNTTKSSEKTASYFYVVCCMGSFCALVQDQDRWLELRSRTDVYEDAPDPVIELLAPFKDRISAETEVVVICDSSQPKFTDALRALFAGHKVTDLSQPDLLWTLVAQN